MKEFTINKFLRLKLEDDKTIIYVNNERFNQCKFLLLDIPIDEITSIEDIESIDDVAQRLNRSLEFRNDNKVQHIIPTVVEFWGHCSNLQVWYENNYNTKLLHSNLAFPLLKKLTQVGDIFAKKVFKEEIALRFSEGNELIKEYLRKEGYLEYLDNEQFCSMLYNIKFSSVSVLLSIIGTYFIADRMSTIEFVEFIKSLGNRRLKKLVVEPKKVSQLIFYKALLEYLEEFRENNSESRIIRDIFKNIGIESFSFLIKLIIDDDDYINLPVLEALIYIDRLRMKSFLKNTKHKFKFGLNNDLWDFQYILNVLLRCFELEELMIYLEEMHRNDLVKRILPRMHGYKFLKMSDQKEIDMKHFLTAFLLEQAGSDDYLENLEKLGNYLADIFISELVDRNNEINEQIIETLTWIGGIAASKLYKKMGELSEYYDIKKYRHMFY
jgi:hypothetical protein